MHSPAHLIENQSCNLKLSYRN